MKNKIIFHGKKKQNKKTTRQNKAKLVMATGMLVNVVFDSIFTFLGGRVIYHVPLIYFTGKNLPLREPQCNLVLMPKYSCPSPRRSVLSSFRQFVCGLMGCAYGEKQQSHFGGFFHTLIQYSKLKKQQRKIETTHVWMLEIP